MKPTKILHLVDSLDPRLGGVCQALRNMVKGLETFHIENEVLSLDEPEAPYLNNDSFIIHAIGKGKGPWKYHAGLIPWLANKCSQYGVIILHGMWLYNGYALHKAMRQYKIKNAMSDTPKIYIMAHGMLDPYFQNAPGRKWKALRNTLYWSLIERFVLNEANGVLFTCEQERHLASKPFTPYKPKQELVIGLGTEEPPPFCPEMQMTFQSKCPGLHYQPYILFLGRLHEKKGVELLIKAYASILKRKAKEEKIFSPTGFSSIQNAVIEIEDRELPRLVIAGPGLESAYGESLKNLVKDDLDLRDRVIFPGMLRGNAKWGAFYGCQAFILPSHQENFGIAVVEALACGKPVLISNQVNIWREISEEGAGIIESNTLAGTINMLEAWQALEYRQKLGMENSARACYQKYFAIDHAARRLLKALGY